MPVSAQDQPMLSERIAFRVPRLSEWLDLIATSDHMLFAPKPKPMPQGKAVVE